MKRTTKTHWNRKVVTVAALLLLAVVVFFILALQPWAWLAIVSSHGDYVFSCDQAALWMVQYVCPSVCLSVRYIFLAATKQLYKWFSPSITAYIWTIGDTGVVTIVFWWIGHSPRVHFTKEFSTIVQIRWKIILYCNRFPDHHIGVAEAFCTGYRSTTTVPCKNILWWSLC